MSSLNLDNYEQAQQSIQSSFGQATSTFQQKFQTIEKHKSLEQGLGSMKAFMSGKPVAKYIMARGKAAVKDAVDKAGLKLKSQAEEGLQRVSTSARAAVSRVLGGNTGNTAADLAAQNPDVIASGSADYGATIYARPSSIMGSGVADSNVGGDVIYAKAASTPFGTSLPANLRGGGAEVEGLAQPPANVAAPPPQYTPTDQAPIRGETNENPMANNYGDDEPPTYDADGYSEDRGEYQRPEGNEGGEDFSKEEGDLDDAGGETEVQNAGQTKSIAQDTKPAGKGAKDGEEEEEGDVEGDAAGEGAGEGGLGALDAIPGLDIISLIAGVGLAVGSALHHPKIQAPVDNIQSSIQFGI